MTRTDKTDLVRRVFGAYTATRREEIEPVLAEDFTFTSPYDDHIDRATYFERCWPNADRIEDFDLERIVVDGDEAFVLYEGRTKTGVRFRNTELHRFADGRIRSVEVFFGLPPGAEGLPPEEAVRRVVEGQAQGIRDKDADAVMAHCAPEMVSFDVVPPLRNQGAGAVRERLGTWFAAYEGPIATELRDIEVAVSGDVAFAYALQRFQGTMTGGTKVDMWVRATLGLRKIEGRWLIVHEHMSDPFDPETGQGRMDLEP